jgi:hypothetical protein
LIGDLIGFPDWMDVVPVGFVVPAMSPYISKIVFPPDNPTWNMRFFLKGGGIAREGRFGAAWRRGAPAFWSKI